MAHYLVNEHFTTALPWVTGHLQTIRDRVVNPTFDLDRISSGRVELVDLPDGDRLAIAINEPAVRLTGQPTVLLIHGLGGSVESYYIRATALGLLRAGYVVARVDLRGSGASAEHCRFLYHGGRTEDLRAVIGALPAPDGVALVGFSLGGNALLKLLGEGPGTAGIDGLPVRGGIAVSAPLDLATSCNHLQEMAFGVYGKFLLGRLRADTSHPALDLTDEDRRAIAAARSLTDFDSAITARKNGWADAGEYYRVNSSGQFLPGIRVPTLVIHAVDDPMIPIANYEAIDWEGLAASTPVRRAITAHGGHVGFHEHGADLPWYVGRVVRHLREVVVPA